MKSTVACLLVLAVATQAQWFPNYQPDAGRYYPGVTGALVAPVAYAGVPAAAVPSYHAVPSFTSSQYHAQDEMGQARFGYAFPGQASSNYRDAMGNQIGSYAYFNPDGKEVRVAYTADHRGFRVLSNDLPVAPVANLVQVPDTIEVAQAKAAHMAAHVEARAALAAARTASVAPVASEAAPAAAETVPVPTA
ncbi:hypothetical protein OUZ56_022351 [Daphnia magna]|uniref:Cuticle protein 6 n=2 Tax=Daphnia magna TaxID=35525 RepID=A0ABR0AW48_9CRUS|nr:hypothetical protein OUZ56_022351 [Daphnia magna]